MFETSMKNVPKWFTLHSFRLYGFYILGNDRQNIINTTILSSIILCSEKYLNSNSLTHRPTTYTRNFLELHYILNIFVYEIVL